MSKRKKTPNSIIVDVIVRSRRRCCICYGLNHDSETKRGQLAHLDKNLCNNDFDNLAFLCFNHHDEYDSPTSQSKGFTKEELKRYREELYAHFGSWGTIESYENLLNFLSSSIDLEMLADVALKVSGSQVHYSEDLAYQVLTWESFESCDGDLYAPYLSVLYQYASWGWLTFEEEENEEENGLITVSIKVNHRPICREVAEIIKKQMKCQ